MRFVGVTIVAWLAGLASYFGVGWVLWHQRIRPGDFRAAIFASLVAVAVSVAAGYGPLMFALGHVRRIWCGLWVWLLALVHPPLGLTAAAAGGSSVILSVDIEGRG